MLRKWQPDCPLCWMVEIMQQRLQEAAYSVWPRVITVPPCVPLLQCRMSFPQTHMPQFHFTKMSSANIFCGNKWKHICDISWLEPRNWSKEEQEG